MSVWATAKGQIDMALEPGKIRKCVVFVVIEREAHVFHCNLNCLRCASNGGEASDG